MPTARCSCGSVEIEAFGPPITSAVCYCDTCQEGARRIEALPNAPAVLDANGGSAFILYRKDRVVCTRGAELLHGYKVDDASTTSRVVAACCNTAMLMRFDDWKHWVPVYRARFADRLPPIEWRICTKYRPPNAVLPADVPASESYPPGFMWKILRSRLAMLFGR